MSDSATTRAEAAVRLLRRLNSGEVVWIPAWSSKLLEETIDHVLSTPGGNVTDLLNALWDLLGETKAALSKISANFILDIVKSSFTRYRSDYDAASFSWMTDRLEGSLPVQAYLAAISLPDNLAHEHRATILDKLRDTGFFEEAQKILSDD
jgi:hypothetical protein